MAVTVPGVPASLTYILAAGQSHGESAVWIRPIWPPLRYKGGRGPNKKSSPCRTTTDGGHGAWRARLRSVGISHPAPRKSWRSRGEDTTLYTDYFRTGAGRRGCPLTGSTFIPGPAGAAPRRPIHTHIARPSLPPPARPAPARRPGPLPRSLRRSGGRGRRGAGDSDAGAGAGGARRGRRPGAPSGRAGRRPARAPTR